MERPSTGISLEHSRPLSRTRLISLAFVGGLHVLFVYALVSGLAVRMAIQLPHELVAQVVDQPQPKTEPPPPVVPNLAQPSLPTVQVPMIKIAQPAVAHPITTYVGPPVPVHVAPVVTAPPVVVPPSPPSAITATHTQPPYPDVARRMNQEGTVRLSIAVGADGRVSDATVASSSGTSALDDAAVSWVKNHWRYKPATQDGRPVGATVEAAIVFNLRRAG